MKILLLWASCTDIIGAWMPIQACTWGS